MDRRLETPPTGEMAKGGERPRDVAAGPVLGRARKPCRSSHDGPSVECRRPSDVWRGYGRRRVEVSDRGGHRAYPIRCGKRSSNADNIVLEEVSFVADLTS